MTNKSSIRLLGLAAVCAAAFAACGGGGGGSSTGNGPVPTPTPTGAATPTATPVATPTASPAVTLSYSNPSMPQGAGIVFSCGCTAQAGTATVATANTVTITGSAPATPASPQPTYTTVPGRNYIYIATSNATNAQAWTMAFAGNSPATDLYLGNTATVDNYATLAALYVYKYSPAPSASATDSATYDDWNFNAISAWVTSLRGGNVNSAEQTALGDIANFQAAGTTLYPGAPRWNTGQASNSTIYNDLSAVAASADSARPTPCPESAMGMPQCTGAPSP